MKNLSVQIDLRNSVNNLLSIPIRGILGGFVLTGAAPAPVPVPVTCRQSR
jgi:hypothetical protein